MQNQGVQRQDYSRHLQGPYHRRARGAPARERASRSLVKAKVDEVKKQALDGAYSKPCAVYSSLVASIERDPATKMGLGKFYHYFPP